MSRRGARIERDPEARGDPGRLPSRRERGEGQGTESGMPRPIASPSPASPRERGEEFDGARRDERDPKARGNPGRRRCWL